jgi:hypothetical protein
VADAEKLLQKWQKTKDPERYEEVEKFLLKSGFIKVSVTKGSHFVFQHPLMKEAFVLFPNYFPKQFHPSGELVIVKHKGKVKNWYLKNVCKAMEYIREIKALKDHR